MVKFDYRQLGRILAKVRLEIYWVMIPILDSSKILVKSMVCRLKKAIIRQPKDKLNYNNICILESLECRLLIRQSCVLRLSQIKSLQCKRWKSKYNSKCSSSSSSNSNKQRLTRAKLLAHLLNHA